MTTHLHQTLTFLLNRVAAAIADAGEHEFRRLGLNLYAVRVLILLHQGSDEYTVGSLAESAALEQSTVSHILRRLEKRGFIVRERQEHDNRSVIVRITEDGKQVAKQCWKMVQQHDSLLRQGLRQEDEQALEGLLTELYRNVPAFRSLKEGAN